MNINDFFFGINVEHTIYQFYLLSLPERIIVLLIITILLMIIGFIIFKIITKFGEPNI